MAGWGQFVWGSGGWGTGVPLHSPILTPCASVVSTVTFLSPTVRPKVSLGSLTANSTVKVSGITIQPTVTLGAVTSYPTISLRQVFIND